jgi:uncharacterized protein with FMN-binding domain
MNASTIRHRRKESTDRLLAVIALATLLGAYLYGWIRARPGSEDIQDSFQALVPAAQRFEPVSESVYAAYQGMQVIAYITIGEALGYGGTIEMAVAVDPQGNVANLAILGHRETRQYLRQVEEGGFPESLVGKSCQDAFRLGQDVDGVTGATYTAFAIAQAVGRGCRQVGAAGVGLQAGEEAGLQIQFGAPEAALLLLFGAGFIAHRPKFKFTRQVRWISMLAGMLILGFGFNRPLSIVQINQLLLGLWPSWQTHLYWYLLLGGVLLVATADNKNPYCEWFCPFGATQECVGFVGGAKARSAGKFKPGLTWLQRGLAWLAIFLALVYRNPGLSTYEVFSALFDRQASTPIFIVLGIVLAASLVIRRPWCNYLCPLRPVVEFIQMIRKWGLELWKKSVRKSS